MGDLLSFLNTATTEELTEIPGISQGVAEGIVAARPFNTVDECLEVNGVGRKLLARIQAALPQIESKPDESALIPTEESSMPLETQQPAAEPPMPIEVRQPANESASEPRPSFGARLQNFLLAVLRAFLRLVLLVLLIAFAAGVIYFGLPWLREQYIAPVEQNAARVNRLESEVADLKNQLKEINANTEKINGRVDELDTSIQAHTESLKKLDSMQSALEKQLKETNDQTLLEMQREIKLTRALDMLARARLYLAQSNFGLARMDVQSARDVLGELQNESNDEVLAQAVSRLDLALGNLPSFPVVASGDLEIAWQILITGEAIATTAPLPASGFTPTPQSFLEVTATTTPIVESTLTPASPTPSPTLEVTTTPTQ